MEKKLFLLGSCLHLEISVIHESRDYSVHIGCDVLDFFQLQFTYAPGKQSLLFDIYNPSVSNYPNVKIVINPNEKRYDPDKDEEQVFKKKEQVIQVAVAEIWKKHWQKGKTANKQKEHSKNKEELAQNIKPVAMKNQENLFVCFLAVKMKFTVVSH
jgi:hypothetical protein